MMNTQNTIKEANKKNTNNWFEEAMRKCGINLRQFGIDPASGVHGGGEVLSGGALVIRKYKGRAAQIWFYRSASGELRLTVKYVKTGKELRVPLQVIDQVPWRTLDQTLEAAAAHGFLRLKRDRKAEMEALREAERSAVSAQEIQEVAQEVEQEVA
jgi:hypothetical protein